MESCVDVERIGDGRASNNMVRISKAVALSNCMMQLSETVGKAVVASDGAYMGDGED